MVNDFIHELHNIFGGYFEVFAGVFMAWLGISVVLDLISFGIFKAFGLINVINSRRT